VAQQVTGSNQPTTRPNSRYLAGFWPDDDAYWLTIIGSLIMTKGTISDCHHLLNVTAILQLDSFVHQVSATPPINLLCW
jgi:hypothetical protein